MSSRTLIFARRPSVDRLVFGERNVELVFPSAQKTRFENAAGVEEQLPPPPSPPQLKEAAQLDGVARPNSVDRVLHPDGTQHGTTEAVNKVRRKRTRARESR